MKKVVVIGSMNMDYVINVPHAPADGETILAEKLETFPGGKGANQAYVLGKLGGEVAMLGAVGLDSPGQSLCDNLQSVGVDTSRVKRLPDMSTGMAFITVDAQGQNRIVVVQGANKAVNVPYIDAHMDLLASSDIVLLQLEIPLETVVYAAEKAKALGKVVVLDPAPARRDIPEQLYQNVDFIKPNEGELATLVGDPEAAAHLEHSAKQLQDCGVKNVVVSLGEKGVFLRDSQGHSASFPADSQVQVVDTTAAGDSFTAALAYGLSRDRQLAEAVDLAVRVSNIVVTRKGAQASIPYIWEVE